MTFLVQYSIVLRSLMHWWWYYTNHTLDVSGAATIVGTTALRGGLNVTGNISGTADIAGQELKIQKGATITGSSVFHGAISGGLGATFVEGVIASTLEASSSVFVGGDLNVTGALSGTHFNDIRCWYFDS